MSEGALPATAPEDQLVPQNSVVQLSGGAMLRKARESSGLHIAALAVSLKVPVKKLEALEADRVDLLPDAVFARALAASVCRTLNIDPGPVLARMPHTASPHLKTDDSGINTPFRSAGGGSGYFVLDQLSRPVVLLVLGLLIGVLILVFFPVANRSVDTSAAKADAALPGSSLRAAEQLPMASKNAPEREIANSAQPTTEASSDQAALTAMNSSAPVAGAPWTGASSSTTSLTTDAEGSTTGLLVFKASAGSWVEVVDAAGVVQLRKTMRTGETVGASGALPLVVVVGRADAVEVQVRGKPLDLKPVAKDNVARFQVN